MNTSILTGFCLGTPKPQPRAKATNRGGFIRIYTPSSAEEWKTAVRCLVSEMSTPERVGKGPDGPADGPLALMVVLYLKRPKRLMRVKDPEGVVSHVTTPDADNLIKAVMDALTDTKRVWFDDCQVQDLYVAKRYVSKLGATGCSIRIAQSQDELPEIFN